MNTPSPPESYNLRRFPVVAVAKGTLAGYFVVCLLLLMGAGLRFHNLTEEVRFHPDEALFATFARNAAVYGDWMFAGPLDKPPLTLYTAALSMHLVGTTVNPHGVLDVGSRQGEFAARLPNTFAGILLIALVYRLTATLVNPRAGVYAAALTALSPWLIAFSATAWTDVGMLVTMTAGLVFAGRGRPGWAGVWLALSLWSKQQAVLYLPLELCYLLLPPSDRVRQLFRFALPFISGILLLLVWDAARGTTSLFALAAVNNNPERVLIRPDELLPRLQIWLDYAGTFFGAGWLTAGLIGVGIVGVSPQQRRATAGLWGYIAVYLLAHWIGAFNTYDRYLLPVLPLLIVVVSAPSARLTPAVYRIGLALLVGLLLFAGSPARFPTDDRGRDADIITLADDLNRKPLGAIIYDHWLGWEMGYYLGAWSDKRRVYYPEPNIQAADARLNPDPAPRYLIAPRDQDLTAWLAAFAAQDFAITPDDTSSDTSSRYIVFRLLPPFAD